MPDLSNGRRRPLVLARGLGRLDLPVLALAAPFLLFPGRYAPAFALLLPLPALGRWLAGERPTRRAGMNGPALALLSMAAIGYLASPDQALSWARLWGLALGVGAYFALLNGVPDASPAGWRRLGRAFAVLTGLVALVSLAGTDWSDVRLVSLPAVYEAIPQLIRDVPGSGVPRTSPFFHPREVGGTLAFLLPLPLLLIAADPAPRWRLLAGVGAALGLVVLLLTQAVMGLFGLGVALWLLLFVRRRSAALAVAGLALGALAAATLLAGPTRVALTLLDPGHPLGVAVVLRLDMWSRALAMLRDMPLSGIGLNAFPLVQTAFYPGYALGPEVHAHNLALQTALDLGLPGLLAFVALLAAFARAARRAYLEGDAARRRLVLGAAAGVVAYLAGGLADAVVLGAKPTVALWGLLGLVAAAAPPEPPRSRRPAWPLAAAVALGLLALLAPVVPLANAGAVLAGGAIVAARRGRELPAQRADLAGRALEAALERAGGRPELAGMLGSLRAWQGADAIALEALATAMAADGPRALERHAPHVAWRRALAGEPPPAPWEGTAMLYQQWVTRFPERAEAVALLALVRERQLDEPDLAKEAVAAGLARGAQPAGLLRAISR